MSENAKTTFRLISVILVIFFLSCTFFEKYKSLKSFFKISQFILIAYYTITNLKLNMSPKTASSKGKVFTFKEFTI